MSNMYKLTRQEAAETLNISTRSVDRYINAWKLRSKKDWKIVYVNQADVDSLLWKNVETKQEVIVEKTNTTKSENSQNISTKSSNENVAWTLWAIYKDLKEEINKKDQIIQNLAMRVWKAEEIANNSVSLLDFKKSQYLLEESKENISKDLEEIKKEKDKLQTELKYEKTSNIILIVFVVILLIVAGLIWFMKI